MQLAWGKNWALEIVTCHLILRTNKMVHISLQTIVKRPVTSRTWEVQFLKVKTFSTFPAEIGPMTLIVVKSVAASCASR